MEKHGWMCHLCSRINTYKEEKCSCCGRPKEYAIKSLGNCSKAKSLGLHADLSTITRPEQVHDMVRSRMDPNEMSSDGFSPMHCAAKCGQASIVRALINEGADIELQAPDGRRALHFAVESGNSSTVQELLSCRVHVNAATTKKRQTALHIACSMGHAAVVEMLLRSGADPFLTTLDMQHTPLHVAAELGHLKCVEVLIQHSDETLLECVDRSGATSIQLAQFAQQTTVYEFLYLHQSDSVLHDRTLDYLLHATSCKPIL